MKGMGVKKDACQQWVKKILDKIDSELRYGMKE